LLHFTSVPLPQDSAAGRRKPLQGTAGHYMIVILLQHHAAVIGILRHSCGQVGWQLTELN